MKSLILDEDIRDLLPMLDAKTFNSLEESILEHGCMIPLVTWNGILIDGYNRYAICTEHNIPFETVEKEFDSREDVIIWVITNQVARRNLTPVQLSYYRGLHYSKERNKTTNPNGNNQYKVVESNNCTQPQTSGTAKILAKQYDVSRDTIFSDAKAASTIDAIGEASKEAKSKVLNGEVKIDKKELKRLSSAPSEEIQNVVDDILNGVYDRKNMFPQSPNVSPVAVTLAGIASVDVSLKRAYGLLEKHLPDIWKATDINRIKAALSNCYLEFQDLQKLIE